MPYTVVFFIENTPTRVGELIDINFNLLLEQSYVLGMHGSASLRRDDQKTKWRLQCKYQRS